MLCFNSLKINCMCMIWGYVALRMLPLCKIFGNDPFKKLSGFDWSLLPLMRSEAIGLNILVHSDAS